MIRKSLALAALVAATGSQFANAADGTINFTGSLTDTTCTITVGGSVSPSVAAVKLPSSTAAKLAKAGDVDGQTGFNVELSACAGTATTAAAIFASGGNVDPVSGNLKNTGTASNVMLQLLDSTSGKTIKAGDASQMTSTSRVNLNADGATVLPYAVQYFATGAATAGTVISAVTYSVDYQ
nr:type 1 fimbrial protein [uncultured Pseudomonas sp.]